MMRAGKKFSTVAKPPTCSYRLIETKLIKIQFDGFFAAGFLLYVCFSFIKKEKRKNIPLAPGQVQRLDRK